MRDALLSTVVSSCVASLVAVLALWYANGNYGNYGYYGDNGHGNGNHGNGYKGLSEAGVFLFKSLDLDNDGLLSPQELSPVIEKLTGKSEELITEPVKQDGGEQVTIRAEFKPLVLESLRSAKDLTLPTFLDDEKVSNGLRNWTTVVKPEKSFNTLDFSTFLPPLKQTELGRAWRIYDPAEKEYKNGRYFPPMPHEKVALLSEMLRMVHPRPFLETRFKPRGMVALVQAHNDEFIKVAFRLHAEFQLNEPPAWPFWFTPAQFTGHVIMSRDVSRVRYFHMYVPAKRALNVDMEWLTRDNELDMEVEIGYLPQLELESVSASGSDQNEAGSEEIVWEEELSSERTEVELEKAMYPFKQITYHPFESVFNVAEVEKKLVHNVVLWGALDDQSC